MRSNILNHFIKNTKQSIDFFDFIWYNNIRYAGVAELADALDLGSSGTPVQVQVLSPAPKKSYHFDTTFFIHYGVMVYHHRTKCGGYHQKERENRSFLHIITR